MFFIIIECKSIACNSNGIPWKKKKISIITQIIERVKKSPDAICMPAFTKHS